MIKCIFAVFVALFVTADVSAQQVQKPPLQEQDTSRSMVRALGTSTPLSLEKWLSLSPSIQSFGAKGDGIVSDAAAFTAAFARTDNPRILLPPGIYRIPCGTYFTAASAVSFVGAGREASIIKYDAGCTLTQNNMTWDGKSGVVLKDLTIDFNNPVVPATLKVGVGFYAYSGDVRGAVIDNVAVINGSDLMFVTAIAAHAGHTFSNPIITNSYITLGTAGLLQNQCIAFTTVDLNGVITGAQVVNNRCVNTGIQYEASSGVISGNDISGFKFGTGIFTAYNNVGMAQGCSNVVISDNVIHDTTAGLDSNDVAFGGIENNCINAVITGNNLYNLGGSGINNYARNVTIANNLIRDNGRNGSGGAGGPCDQAGICIAVSPLGVPYDSDNLTVTGNKVWDTGGGTQLTGYMEAPGFTGRAVLRGNDFRGGGSSPQSIKIASASTNADVEFVSKKAALVTSVSSLEWTALDTASFKHWTLQCRNMTPVTAARIGIQVGQGATPTWMTGAHYAPVQTYNNGSTVVVSATASATAMWVGADTWDDTQSGTGLFTVEFGDLAYALGFKTAKFSGGYTRAAGGLANTVGAAEWINDTTAVTALRVIADGVNLYGSCTLAGRP